MTDLLDELLQNANQNKILGKITQKGAYGVLKYELNVNKKLSIILKKGTGHYVTFKAKQNFLWSKKIQNYISKQLCLTLNNFYKKLNKNIIKLMVVGLGNGNMVCDSLGSLVCHGLCVVNSDILSALNLPKLCYILPSVEGLTGVSSYDIIYQTVRKIKPDVVLAVDSLTAFSLERLGLTFQVSNAGILPGGGVDSGKKILNKYSLGVPVISVGVPLLIGIESITQNSCDGIYRHFTPKEIDFVIKKCAYIISNAINNSLYSKDILNRFC